MKIHILSDVHLGCAPMSALPVLGDALVLAGDICDGYRDHLFHLVSAYHRAKRPVLFVPGNHEFYGHTLSAELLRLWRECRKRGVELLHNRAVVHQGVRFLGSTLWTDFALEGRPWLSKLYAQQGMADYSQITHAGRCLTPDSTVRFHERALRFFERAFANPYAGPTVVITHHGPHPNSVHARFQRHPLNPGFVSNLSEQIGRWAPALWVHGHVHNQFDYRLGVTRVLVNPRGYENHHRLVDGTQLVRREHAGFDPGLVVDLR